MVSPCGAGMNTERALKCWTHTKRDCGPVWLSPISVTVTTVRVSLSVHLGAHTFTSSCLTILLSINCRFALEQHPVPRVQSYQIGRPGMPLSPQGFEAWIEVDGRKLEEFKIEMEWEKVVCWVPCEAGKVCERSIFISVRCFESPEHQ